MAAESTYGVAPSLTSAHCYEFKTESLELKKTAVQGEGLAAGHVYERTKRRVITQYDVSGAITMDCPTRQLGFLLQYIIGDFLPEVPTEIGTSGIYKTVFQPKSALRGQSLTIQKGVPTADNATVEPFTYVGMKMASSQIKVSTGAIAELTMNFDGRNELAGAGNGDPLNGSVPTLATWSLPSTGLGESVFHFKEATLSYGGTPTLTSGVVSLTSSTPAAEVKDCTIGQSYSYDNTRIFLGGNGFKSEPIENNYRKITGSFTAEWQSSEAFYNAFSADTTTSLELTFTGPTVGTSNYLLDIIIPNIKLEGESPKVGGPAVVTQALNFVGLDDEATVPIQVTYQSEDVAL